MSDKPGVTVLAILISYTDRRSNRVQRDNLKRWGNSEQWVKSSALNAVHALFFISVFTLIWGFSSSKYVRMFGHFSHSKS